MMGPLHIQIKKELRDMSGNMVLDVDLQLESGEWLGLHGPSGAGKTSLIRLIAGLDQPDQGRIYADKIPWSDGKQFLPVKDRNLGMVFQDQALFPNLRLQKQIAFGQERNKQDQEYVAFLIEKLGLKGLEKAQMGALSGGQRQRVALGRALAGRPKLLLLDEPFQGLDPESLEHVIDLLNNFRIEDKPSVILISHQPEIHKRLTHRVVRLERGKVIDVGLPTEIFPESVATINQIVERETYWEVEFEINGHPGQSDLPKTFFPQLRKGDQIKLTPGSFSEND